LNLSAFQKEDIQKIMGIKLSPLNSSKFQNNIQKQRFNKLPHLRTRRCTGTRRKATSKLFKKRQITAKKISQIVPEEIKEEEIVQGKEKI